MKTVIKFQYSKIEITEPKISDVYFIEQADDNKFYITSTNGYNGYEAEGYIDLEKAIKHVKEMIKMYFIDRCEENPKGW